MATMTNLRPTPQRTPEQEAAINAAHDARMSSLADLAVAFLRQAAPQHNTDTRGQLARDLHNAKEAYVRSYVAYIAAT
jgi:hypothetical protein